MPGALKVWNGDAWQTASASGSNTSVFVGPSAPAGAPRSGDLWYDTDEPSPIASVVGITAGGTGASNATTARSNLSVPQIGQSGSVAGAPTTGTWARGDQWLDSTNVLWLCTTGGTPGTWIFVGTNIRTIRYLHGAGNVALTNPTSYTFLPDATARNATKMAFSKRMSSSRLLVLFTVHFYISAGGSQQYWGGLNNGTQTWDITTRWSQIAAPAYHDLVGHTEITGLVAGSYVFEPVFKSATTATINFDQNWELDYSIQEVP